MKRSGPIHNVTLRRAAIFCLLLGATSRLHAQQPDDVATRLLTHVITQQDFARSVFYTWTTPDQITALRQTKTLLVATAKTGGGRPSPFIRMLSELREGRKPGYEAAALLLDHPALMRRRYAWTSPFATVLGLGERSYGTELIQVVLRPNARILRFDPEAAMPFTFVNLRGEEIPYRDGVAAPERIGAIYHVRTRGPSDFVPFREYILCNEAMVQSFAIATDEIRNRLAEETALLHTLRDRFATLPANQANASAVSAWSGSDLGKDAPLIALWRAAQAFDNRKYRPLAKNFDKMIEGLAAYGGSGPPLSISLAP